MLSLFFEISDVLWSNIMLVCENVSYAYEKKKNLFRFSY